LVEGGKIVNKRGTMNEVLCSVTVHCIVHLSGNGMLKAPHPTLPFDAHNIKMHNSTPLNKVGKNKREKKYESLD
jgi:hypothetical protein